MAPSLTCPPPTIPNVRITHPLPHVLLVTLDRPKQLNALRRAMHAQFHRLWAWYDNEPSLRCAVITGTGRAFCAGADLKEWFEVKTGAAAGPSDAAGGLEHGQDDGFGGLSDRRGRKPVIAAVNGLCLGGGMEMAINADMIIASSSARFGLPEATRGVIAVAGALPRLIRTVGRQRASEMALLGRMYTAQDMLSWGIVNHIVDDDGDGKGGGAQRLLDEALRWAAELVGNSPDSVIVSRAGLMGGWDGEDPKASTARLMEGVYRQLESGENIKEGVTSFVEKRKPVWKDSKL